MTSNATSPVTPGSPRVVARVPESLIDAAKANHPELADETMSVIIRVGLAVLAGVAISKAIDSVKNKNYKTERLEFSIKSP
jgi:hypothetical protein